jgi:hypothetical protein
MLYKGGRVSDRSEFSLIVVLCGPFCDLVSFCLSDHNHRFMNLKTAEPDRDYDICLVCDVHDICQMQKKWLGTSGISARAQPRLLTINVPMHTPTHLTSARHTRLRYV